MSENIQIGKYPITKRAVYYVSRMISSQKNRVFSHSRYERIRKVVSVWIQMNVDGDVANTITEYGIVEKNIVWLIFLEMIVYNDYDRTQQASQRREPCWVF